MSLGTYSLVEAAGAGLGAAAGSIAGQVAGKQRHIVNDFHWGQVGAAALTAGVLDYTGWAANSGNAGDALSNAIANNVVGQASSQLFNQTDHFDWGSLHTAIYGSVANAALMPAPSTTWDSTAQLVRNFSASAISGAVDKFVMHRDRIDWASVAGNAIASTLTGYLDRNQHTSADPNATPREQSGLLGEMWGTIKAALKGQGTAVAMPMSDGGQVGHNVSNAQQAEAVAQTNITMDANGNANFGYLAADTVGGPPYVRLFDGSLPVLPLGEHVETSEREAASTNSNSVNRQSSSRILSPMEMLNLAGEVSNSLAAIAGTGENTINDTLLVKGLRWLENKTGELKNAITQINDVNISDYNHAMSEERRLPLFELDPIDKWTHSLEFVSGTTEGLIGGFKGLVHEARLVAEAYTVGNDFLTFGLLEDSDTVAAYKNELGVEVKKISGGIAYLLNNPDDVLNRLTQLDKRQSGEVFGNLVFTAATIILPGLGEVRAAEEVSTVGRSLEELGAAGRAAEDLWGTGPLKPPHPDRFPKKDPLASADQKRLIDESYGLQSRLPDSGIFEDVVLGKVGTPNGLYLYTVDNRGLNVALEAQPIGVNEMLKHSNLSSQASIGGEAWFGGNNTVHINPNSGRYGNGQIGGYTEQQWASTIKLWGSLGYKVIPH